MGIDIDDWFIEDKNGVRISCESTTINYYEDLIKESSRPMGSKERIYNFKYMKKEIRELILGRDNYTCKRCLKKGEVSFTRDAYGNINQMLMPPGFVVHHIIPRNLGGSNHPSNLVTLCNQCHPKIHRSRKPKEEDRRFLSLGKDVKITFPLGYDPNGNLYELNTSKDKIDELKRENRWLKSRVEKVNWKLGKADDHIFNLMCVIDDYKKENSLLKERCD